MPKKSVRTSRDAIWRARTSPAEVANPRINIRPSPEDVATITAVAQITGQTRSDVLRTAIAIAAQSLQRPLVFVRKGEIEEASVTIPSATRRSRGWSSEPPIQVRKDPAIQGQLRSLVASRKFGGNAATAIRSSLLFYWSVLQRYALGWECRRKDRTGGVAGGSILDELGVRVRSDRIRTSWFRTKPT